MSQLTAILIVVLLPGIIAAMVADALTRHSKWDSFKYGLYSFVLGVLSYVILQLFNSLGDLLNALCGKPTEWSHLAVWNALDGGSSVIPWKEIALAALISVPLAYVVAWIVNHKVVNKLGQLIRVTTKYGDENLYSYYLNAKEIDWIYIRDQERNLSYRGRIVMHSENDKIQELVLSEVSVYRYEDSAFLYSLPTIYLAREMGQFTIESAT